MVFSLDETCCVSSCVVLRRVAALNFIFPALTTPLSAQAFLGYDVLETTASSYLKVPVVGSTTEQRSRKSARERQSRKNIKVAPAPISSRFLCPRPPPAFIINAPYQNCHATQAIKATVRLVTFSHPLTYPGKLKSATRIFFFFSS